MKRYICIMLLALFEFVATNCYAQETLSPEAASVTLTTLTESINSDQVRCSVYDFGNDPPHYESTSIPTLSRIAIELGDSSVEPLVRLLGHPRLRICNEAQTALLDLGGQAVKQWLLAQEATGNTVDHMMATVLPGTSDGDEIDRLLALVKKWEFKENGWPMGIAEQALVGLGLLQSAKAIPRIEAISTGLKLEARLPFWREEKYQGVISWLKRGPHGVEGEINPDQRDRLIAAMMAQLPFFSEFPSTLYIDNQRRKGFVLDEERHLWRVLTDEKQMLEAIADEKNTARSRSRLRMTQQFSFQYHISSDGKRAVGTVEFARAGLNPAGELIIGSGITYRLSFRDRPSGWTLVGAYRLSGLPGAF